MDSEQPHLKSRTFPTPLLLLLVLMPRLVFAQEPVHSLQELPSRVRIGDTMRTEGGELIACGTPEQAAKCKASHTGKILAEVLQ